MSKMRFVGLLFVQFVIGQWFMSVICQSSNRWKFLSGCVWLKRLYDVNESRIGWHVMVLVVPSRTDGNVLGWNSPYVALWCTTSTSWSFSLSSLLNIIYNFGLNHWYPSLFRTRPLPRSATWILYRHHRNSLCWQSPWISVNYLNELFEKDICHQF